MMGSRAYYAAGRQRLKSRLLETPATSDRRVPSALMLADCITYAVFYHGLTNYKSQTLGMNVTLVIIALPPRVRRPQTAQIPAFSTT